LGFTIGEGILNFLEYLAESQFAEWVRVSMLGFPTLIALHSVGMGVVVGLTLMVCLRLYRIVEGFSAQVLPKLLAVAVWGFGLNLVTGLMLFFSRGPEYIAAGIFLIKMLLVLCSAAIVFWLRLRLAPLAEASGEPLPDERAKTGSLVATVLWFGAVFAGRLIAYVSDLY
jgi:hypothetical protein